MKTLDEIKDEVAKDNGYGNYNNALDHINAGVISGFSFSDMSDEIARLYAIEVAKQALINASDTVRRKDFIFGYDCDRSIESILSESNIPNLD